MQSKAHMGIDALAPTSLWHGMGQGVLCFPINCQGKFVLVGYKS